MFDFLRNCQQIPTVVAQSITIMVVYASGCVNGCGCRWMQVDALSAVGSMPPWQLSHPRPVSTKVSVSQHPHPLTEVVE